MLYVRVWKGELLYPNYALLTPHDDVKHGLEEAKKLEPEWELIEAERIPVEIRRRGVYKISLSKVEVIEDVDEQGKEALRQYQLCHLRGVVEEYIPWYIAERVMELADDLAFYKLGMKYVFRGRFKDCLSENVAIYAPPIRAGWLIREAEYLHLFSLAPDVEESRRGGVVYAQPTETVRVDVEVYTEVGISIVTEFLLQRKLIEDITAVGPKFVKILAPIHVRDLRHFKAAAAAKLYDKLVSAVEEPVEIPRDWYYRIVDYHPSRRIDEDDIEAMFVAAVNGVLELWVRVKQESKGYFIGKGGQNVKAFQERLGIRVRVL